jgi:porin
MHKILSVNATVKTRICKNVLTQTVVSVVSLQSLLVLGTYQAKAETSFDFATPQLEEISSMSQVTNVNQLSDVQPTDWAFQALQSLVERYGCIAGYPNGTFRGNRAMTRYEFAAGLNACLNRVNELIATATADLVKKEDLAILQKLQEQFTAELATLRGRVDALETKSAELEANQFSTTTKLLGQVIMSANAGGFSGSSIVDPTGIRVLAATNPNPTILYRASIGLNTSFTGTDLLKVQLDGASGSIVNGRPDAGRDNATGVLEPFFGSQIDYSVKPATVNTLDIGRLYYTFKPTKDLAVSFGPDIRTTDYVDRNSYAYLSFLDFSTQAFINNYLLFPINGPSSGAAIDWKPGNGPISVRALYAATNASNPGDRGLLIGTAPFTNLLYPGLNPQANVASKRGIFGSTYQTTTEIEYAPSRAFAIRLQYSGGEIIDQRFDVFGVNAELTLAEKFGIFGRYGYGNYSGTDFGDIKPNYWMAGIAMRDLFTQGALAGIAVGQPFIVNQIGNSTQTNYEAFYNYPFSRNIQITPTFQMIQNAANQSSNSTIYTGTLRTVFSF